MTAHQELGTLLREQREIISSQALHIQYEQMPELNPLRTLEFDEASLRDTKYTLLYLADAIKVNSPKLFISYIHWFSDILKGLNLPLSYLEVSLHSIASTAKTHLDSKYKALLDDYIQEGLSALNEHKPLIEPENKSVLHGYMNDYVNYLLDGKRQAASLLIDQLIEQNYSVEEIYVDIFQESQYKIGKLWQSGKISVSEEHYCTASTQLIMGQLYPLIFATPKNDYVFVGTCIGGELHELGIRMVSDFFELDGWNTYYLGANTPIRSIVDTVVAKKANVVGLSTTMGYHIADLIKVIDAIRQHPDCQNVKILVGGYPFIVDAQLWKTVGADGTASNAKKAITLANELMLEETR
jgi:methanogenic corrinoid protein MtbC1